MHRLLTLLFVIASTLAATAQKTVVTAPVDLINGDRIPQPPQGPVLPHRSFYAPVRPQWTPHLDLAVTAGSTGIGFQLAMPINKYLGVRAGASFMPHFKYPLTFTAQIGDGDQMAGDGQQTRFQRMAELLEGFVGQAVDDQVDMVATPNMNQAHLLLDLKPFHDKRWHITTGFYAGNSKIGHCINRPHETSSLFAINLYNRLYEKNGEIAMGVSLPPEILLRIMSYGRAGFPVGYYVNDVVYQEDIWGQEEAYDDFGDIYLEDVIIHAKGEIIHRKGDVYLMAPHDDNTAFADAFVDKFRPYFGFGYSDNLDSRGRWKVGFDAGVMFWGGAPRLIDHSGLDLMYDVENIDGQVGRYVEIARHAKAFPVIELKISRRLF